MDMLIDPELTVEQRLCVVNYIGWNNDGQHHFEELVDHYVKVQRYSSAKQAFAAMDGAMLTVFAYVRAMDDYYVVDDALRLADEAVRRSPVSRAAAMVQALIRGQQLTDDMTRWNDIYTACHRVETNAKLNHDLSPAAVNAIMEYINGYAE